MSGRQGFTLVEIIVALVIFSIMMGGLMSAGLVASNQLKVGQSDAQVWEVATYQMEKLIALGYDSIKPGKDTILGYPVDWKINGNSPKRLYVTVDRKSIHGSWRPESFETYIMDPDS